LANPSLNEAETLTRELVSLRSFCEKNFKALSYTGNQIEDYDGTKVRIFLRANVVCKKEQGNTMNVHTKFHLNSLICSLDIAVAMSQFFMILDFEK
jgi:hypothetical protein